LDNSSLKAENFTLSRAFDNAAVFILSILAALQKLILSKSKLVFDKPITKEIIPERSIFLVLVKSVSFVL